MALCTTMVESVSDPAVRTRSVVIAEDHPLTRHVLRDLLNREKDLRVIGESEDGEGAVQKVLELRPDVLVTDLKMPGLTGLEVARVVRARCPETVVVIVSNFAEAPYVEEALRGGVSGYVDKGSMAKDLVAGVREALAGRRFLSPSITESGA